MRRMRARVAVIALLVETGAAYAQAPRPVAPVGATFAAASIRRNVSADTGSAVGRRPGGRLEAQNATLRELILFAYPLQDTQLVGEPGWVNTDRWNISAALDETRAAAPDSREQTTVALRALLADRFKLALRPEVRDLSVYALVRVRDGGAPGPSLRPSTVDCPALQAAMSRGEQPAGGPPRSADGRPLCESRGTLGTFEMAGMPLSNLASALSNRVQRIVVDRTGFTGTWDVTLKFAPEASQAPRGTLAPGDALPAADPNGASLFTALQEQLGLKLESARAPVDVTVIDRAERAVVE
jgi:uncharacterized protein (TIGR03435 family)